MDSMLLFCNNLILVILNTGYPAVGGSCGTLEFEKPEVTEGNSVKLIYSPRNVHGSRLWLKVGQSSPTHLYDSSKPSHDWSYTEHREGDKYTLLFTKVGKADTGDYFVYCGSTYTGPANLTVLSSGCGSLRARTNNISEGITVHFEFSIDPDQEFIWEKKINSTFKKLLVNSRYDTFSAKGFYYLFIYQSEYIDSGEYRVNCDPAVSNSVYLNIFPTAPSAPEFSNVANIHDCQNCIPAQLNVKVVVECFVKGGSEPVDLNIFKDGKIISNLSRRSENKNAIKYTFAGNEYVPTTADFDATFTCTVKNPALTTEIVTSAVLYIKVQPKTMVLKANLVVENEPSSIECLTTEARPPAKSEIFIDGHKANKTETTQVVQTGHIYSVTTTTTRLFTRFENQAKILCCSTILNRTCSKKQTLNVKFPPRKVSIAEIRKDNQDNGDTEVMLNCSVDESNPQSSIEWKGIKNVPRNMSEKITEYHNSTHGWTFNVTWVFNLTKEDNYRNIRCAVRNQEFPDLVLEHSYRPNITYSPTVTISGHKRTETYFGADVSFSCNVDSNPPSFIRWYNETDLIKESYGSNTLELLLANISLNHSQIYSCTAENNIGGIKTRSVFLIVKEKTPQKARVESSSASIVGLIVGCSILAIAIMAAIIVFVTIWKKRQNVHVQTKGTDDLQLEERISSVNRGKSVNPHADDGTSHDEENVNEQREYAYIGTDNEGIETHVYSDPINNFDNEKHSTVATGAKCWRTNPDLKYGSDIVIKKPLTVQGEQTKDSVYVNSMQPEYEGLLSTNRKETDTYSKLGAN